MHMNIPENLTVSHSQTVLPEDSETDAIHMKIPHKIACPHNQTVLPQDDQTLAMYMKIPHNPTVLPERK